MENQNVWYGDLRTAPLRHAENQSSLAILKMGPTTWYGKLQLVKYSYL
jgi:hypothetical protein